MKRLPAELVIFDRDGVLVDSERICVGVDAVIPADRSWSESWRTHPLRHVGAGPDRVTGPGVTRSAYFRRVGHRAGKSVTPWCVLVEDGA
ncbi:hypothetical protein GCM10015535_42700 [Streptomyces gelaticus]|uniref:Phosphatase n=1 Tax=Streptomyces gelaticus TaxID=285446 RepID=A0ABQ2W2K1_9ACTN|nr:hypothetical protein [Streptomyces gelaticus]GGV89249.1 hypothetical protein GCM10015535_42700 [Streptomyces gelaticus]